VWRRCLGHAGHPDESTAVLGIGPACRANAVSRDNRPVSHTGIERRMRRLFFTRWMTHYCAPLVCEGEGRRSDWWLSSI
jgi:hypothetical protein